MAQRGGPWRLAGYAIPDGAQGPRELARRESVATPDADRGLAMDRLGLRPRPWSAEVSSRSSGWRRGGGEAGTEPSPNGRTTWRWAADGTPAHRPHRDEPRRTGVPPGPSGGPETRPSPGGRRGGAGRLDRRRGGSAPVVPGRGGVPVSARRARSARPGRGDVALTDRPGAWRARRPPADLITMTSGPMGQGGPLRCRISTA